MHNFDIKYTLDDYYEYYSFVMFKQRMIREIIFFTLFVGIGVYWLIDQSEQTQGIFLPIFSFAMAVLIPLMTLAYIPLIRGQLKKRQEEIDKTHINVTFNEDEVVYENLTINPEKPVEPKPEVSQDEATEVEEKPAEPEVVEEKATEVNKEENIFRLKYENFMVVKETKHLFLFYLDRSTCIIIPKNKYTTMTELDSFKEFILGHINPKRVRFASSKK